ncbi:COG2827: putative endonuclease containing a URI domain [hydrothermal vent metagenome]|uniref:COG2827: putative endonuclease containing a URI domain n=1 Tax=hydrothermal vent metagenome TaxID=652676 RepID=A0A3B0Y5R2_9ZZZZ
MSWYVYIVRCVDNTLYTGIAIDLDKRLGEHNNDNKKAAKYTRARRPVELVYSETCESRSVAASREFAIKRLNRNEKEKMIHEDEK